MAKETIKQIILLTIAVLSINCGPTPDGKSPIGNIPDSEAVLPSNFEWKEIVLPIYGYVLVVEKDRVFIIGETGFASLDSSLEKPRLIPFKFEKAFLTTDGGLTRKRMIVSGERRDNEERYTAELCGAENAVFNADVLWVFAICEHTSQVWKVRFSNEGAVIDLTDFTYRSGSETEVLGPRGLPDSADPLLIPSLMADGSALLSETKNGDFFVRWQGEDQRQIVDLDFAGKNGWLLIHGGKLLHSGDNGKNWKPIGTIPMKPDGYLVGLGFRDEKEGFVVERHSVLKTTDGGRTWAVQLENTERSLSEITVDYDIALVYSDEGDVYVNLSGSGKWTKVSGVPQGHISSAKIFENRILLLIDGKLYSAPVIR